MGQQQIRLQTIPVSEARQKLGELVNEVYRRHARYIVQKSGIPVVALVALSDLERWMQMDREYDEIEGEEMIGMSLEKDRVVAAPPTGEELKKRQALVAKIMTKSKERIISPTTTADLVRKVRDEERKKHETWPH